MKILCVADQIDPLVYSTQIKQRFQNVELILGAGDLPLEYYSFIVSNLNVPLMFVYGNHNLGQRDYFRGKQTFSLTDPVRLREHHLASQATGATYIDGLHHRSSSILVAGLGGCMRYNQGENQFTEFQMGLRILKLLPGLLWNRLRYGRFLDILLTHAPPRGIHDRADLCHWGFRVFLPFMRFFKPRYLIHGHIHLYELNEIRKSTYHQTTVLNCYNHLVLDIDDAK